MTMILLAKLFRLLRVRFKREKNFNNSCDTSTVMSRYCQKNKTFWMLTRADFREHLCGKTFEVPTVREGKSHYKKGRQFVLFGEVAYHPYE